MPEKSRYVGRPGQFGEVGPEPLQDAIQATTGRPWPPSRRPLQWHLSANCTASLVRLVLRPRL